MQNQAKITKQDILDRLKPLCCVYDTGETTDLLNVPQNEEELEFVREQVRNYGFHPISHSDAHNLGFNEMSSWSNENDYLFISDDDWFILCMPKSLFEA